MKKGTSMTGILDRIRNTTPADLDKITGDFSDDKPYVIPSKQPKNMVRIVEGATDLRPAIPQINTSGGTSLAADWSGDSAGVDHGGERCNNPRCCPVDDRGMPSERQREFISSLLTDLLEVDNDSIWYDQAVDYTNKMNENRAWDRSRGGNVSRWITNLKSKIAELKSGPKPVVASNPATEDLFTDVPDGRYAVQDSGPGDWIFVKVSTGRKDGPYAGRRFVKLQASDEFHPIRNASRRRAILNAIRVMTPQESMLAYGQHIGACGHCGRTLTNDESRAQGIGPKCRAKMGW